METSFQEIMSLENYQTKINNRETSLENILKNEARIAKENEPIIDVVMFPARWAI